MNLARKTPSRWLFSDSEHDTAREITQVAGSARRYGRISSEMSRAWFLRHVS